MSTNININIKASGDKKFTVNIDTKKTVLDLKNEIAITADVPADKQRLIYSGRVLKDQDTLEETKIIDGNTVHMVKGSGAAKAAPTNSAATNTNTTTSATTTTATPSDDNNNTNATQAPNPFAGFAGMPTNTQSNPFNMFGSGFGAGAMGNSFGGVNPNEMLQNPMFAQYMSSVLENPAVLDSIIATNPQLSTMGPEIRSMMQTPQFRQMLSNPDMIRQMAAMSSSMSGMGSPTMSPANNNTTNTTAQPNPFAGFGNAPPVDPQLQQRMAALFGSTPASAPAPAPAPTGPPEEIYQVQLQQLSEMGFWDAAKNIRALQNSRGDVNAALEELFNS